MERRRFTKDVVTKIDGYHGVELVISGLSVLVEGEPVLEPAPCVCGHPSAAHEWDGEGYRGVCCLGRGYAHVGNRSVGCGCQAYQARDEPREISFNVDRVLQCRGDSTVRARAAVS